MLMLVIGLSSPALAAATALAASRPGAAQAVKDQDKKDDKKDQDKNARDRQKAAEREAKDVRENKEILADAQDEIDAGVQQLLSLPFRYDDLFLQEYVNEVGQSMVPSETPAGVLFSFRVVRAAEPNAMAFPDGRIFVTTGLLTFIDNEAQLAFVLGHEVGHVLEHHFEKNVRESRTRAKVGAAVGAGLGAILGGIAKGKEGAVTGAVAGVAAGVVIAAVTMNSYSRQQEDEADRRGAMLALDRKFDVKEGSVLFKKLADTFGEEDKFSNALWGRHSRNVERVENVDRLLAGDLAARYNPLRGSGELTLGSGQMYLYTSAMIRDVAIDYVQAYDRYDLAKGLLERISTYRARDPKTLWALGRVYKMVGRTAADRNKALDLLQQAVRLDERNRHPEFKRDYGLMQARLGNTAGAVESLKSYVLNYQELRFEEPDDLETMYDYLLTFGDSTWKAPKIDTRIVRASVEEPAAPSPAAPAAAPAPTATAGTAPATKQPQNTLRPTPTPTPKPQPRK
jgi:hypothetical protein